MPLTALAVPLAACRQSDCPPFKVKKHTDNYEIREYEAGKCRRGECERQTLGFCRPAYCRLLLPCHSRCRQVAGHKRHQEQV